MHTNTCAYCGVDFTPSRPERVAEQRFCSRRCGITAAHAHRRATPTPPWQERFWRFLPEPLPDGCWEWQGQIDPGGYGRLMLTRTPKYRVRSAHRASWEIHNGLIPEGMKVCHRCDNPPCVNPAHLFLGTQAENVADMMHKGRWNGAIGPANNLTRYSTAEVAEVRQLAEEGLSFREIARRTGMSHSHVAKVARHEIRRVA